MEERGLLCGCMSVWGVEGSAGLVVEGVAWDGSIFGGWKHWVIGGYSVLPRYSGTTMIADGL